MSNETDRVRSIQDKQAPGYDRSMDFYDRVRNVPLYPPDVPQRHRANTV